LKAIVQLNLKRGLDSSGLDKSMIKKI